MNPHLTAIWPPPAVVRSALLPGRAGTDYLAVPSTRAPRLLVPTGVRGADRMLVRHGGGLRTRVARAALRMAHRGRLSSWAPMPRLQVTQGPAGIEQHLARVLGRPVVIGVLLGPPRANLKPVLQVFDRDGTVLAFAKVATSVVTAPLLRDEAAALERLTQHPVEGIVTPALLDIDEWHGHQVLVQQALPAAQSGRQPTALPTAALAGIASTGGLRRTTLAESAFWQRVSDVGPASWNGVDVSSLALLARVVDPTTAVLFGAWHGDFGPWNAAWGTHALEVWDWERFDPDVPAGLDAAHWRAQLDLGTGPSTAWEAMCRDVSQVLEAAQGGVGERQDRAAALVAACYVLAIWARYRLDAATSATPALRARVAWLCSLVDAAVPTLEGARR